MDTLLIQMIQDFLAGDLPLDGLQRLLIDLTWGRTDQVSPRTLNLAKNIELYIAEFTSRHISEEELRRLIRHAAGLTAVVVTVGDLPSESAFWQSSASSTRRKVELA